ncbi:hypothetical protein, partial [Pseudomonas poae]|uniref:hypothetical protein n=1 Tax=Pseudomonas poae TaxID=200451 RepID=UPI0034D7A8CE
LRVGWHAYVWYNRELKEKKFGNHFVRASLLRTWMRYKALFYKTTPLWIPAMEAHQRRLLGWRTWPRYKDTLVKGKSEIKS